MGKEGAPCAHACACDTRVLTDLTEAPPQPPTSPLLGLVPYFLSQGTMFLKEETKCVSVRQQRARAGGWDGGRLPGGLGSCSAFTLHLITGTRVFLATQASVAAFTAVVHKRG